MPDRPRGPGRRRTSRRRPRCDHHRPRRRDRACTRPRGWTRRPPRRSRPASPGRPLGRVPVRSSTAVARRSAATASSGSVAYASGTAIVSIPGTAAILGPLRCRDGQGRLIRQGLVLVGDRQRAAQPDCCQVPDEQRADGVQDSDHHPAARRRCGVRHPVRHRPNASTSSDRSSVPWLDPGSVRIRDCGCPQIRIDRDRRRAGACPRDRAQAACCCAAASTPSAAAAGSFTHFGARLNRPPKALFGSARRNTLCHADPTCLGSDPVT